MIARDGRGSGRGFPWALGAGVFLLLAACSSSTTVSGNDDEPGGAGTAGVDTGGSASGGDSSQGGSTDSGATGGTGGDQPGGTGGGTGGAATGGERAGGAGGADHGGTAGETGGSQAGGAGGADSGGAAGAATGGNPAGGAGGADSGGTGGAATGGAGAGGAATGGAETGGAATGGASSCSLTVRRVLVDAAQGELTANGLACEPTCSLVLPCGSTVSVDPTPGAEAGFSWNDTSGACVGTMDPCEFRLTLDATIEARFLPFNRAFVTSTTSSSSLGGLAGADATCRNLAAEAGLPSADSYVAFLSTSTTGALSRLGSARGWVRPDGLPFADTISDIEAGTLWNPLVLTEEGTTAAFGSDVYTGSTRSGASQSGYDCNGWTDATSAYNVQGGVVGGGSGNWLTWGAGDCSQISAAHLYCFGTAYEAVLPPPPPISGRRVFMSSTRFSPRAAGSIGDADAVCADDAVANGLCASTSDCPFKAVLAQPGASAKSHFANGDGSSRIVRLDNVVVAASSSNFWLGNLSAPIDMYADGSHSGQGERVFTGATTPSAAGTATSSCGGWSDPSVTTGVNYGVPMLGPNWFGWTTLWGCNESNPVYCLEDVP